MLPALSAGLSRGLVLARRRRSATALPARRGAAAGNLARAARDRGQPWRPSGSGGGGGGGAGGAEGPRGWAGPAAGAMSQGGGVAGESGEPEAKVLHTKRLYR